jgi:hypothetical protein
MLIAVLFSIQALGQDIYTNSVVSPSPSVASMARYSEVPVDQSTGVPQISVPLHIIESQKLSYPITLNYHASGIKVSDVAGPLGLGWSLGGGGAITRIMRGRPDEKPNGFFQFASAIPNYNDNIVADDKDNLATRTWDMMPDLFYFNTGTAGGKIIFDNQLQARCIPRNALKIATSSTSTLSTFTITDPGGTTYKFDPGETATATIPGIVEEVSYISSWYLSSMISADKLDTIRFNYTLSSSYGYTTAETAGLALYYNVPPNATRTLNELNPLNSNIVVTVTGTRYLSSIEHKGGRVNFVFNTGRTDDPAGRKLDQIIIYTSDPISGNLVEDRKINFSYTYFTNTDGSTRLRLDSFREQFSPTIFNPPSVFSYSHKKLPPVGSPAQDHWGYYNGAILNNSLIPAYTHQGIVLSTNDRGINSSYVDGCILKSIHSPLTGVTEFVFEPNIYYNGSANVAGPGLRINKIIKRDLFSAINSITNYEYLNPATGNSSGILTNGTPEYFTTLDVIDMKNDILKEYQCLLIQANGTSVGNFPGAPLIYEYVTVYNNNDVNTTGKVVSKYSVLTPPVNPYPYFPVDDISWTAGDLLTQEIYKVQGGVSTFVKRIENTYALSPHFYTIKGLNAVRKKIFYYGFPGANDFYIRNYFTYSKFSYLRETKIYDYEQNSNTLNAVTTINNYYDKTNVHLFPTRTKTSTSLSTDTLKREFKYPQDYTATGVIGVMQTLNMVGQPLEIKNILVKSGASYITGYSKTEFFEWKPNKVYPKNFFTGKIPVNLTTTTFNAAPATYTKQTSKINAYDKQGAPVESEAIGGRPESVIIDNNINRVIASAGTSSANQIAYSSFESSDYGNWKITTGVLTSTKNVFLNLNYTVESIYLQSAQTVSYSYTTTKSNGPSPVLVFSKVGATPVNVLLSNSSGSGSVSLSAGSWSAELVYDFNVTALSANFSYQRTTPAPANIVTTKNKTGNKSFQFTSTQQILKDSLPSGTYTVVYYQYGGTVTVTPSGGAVVNSTVTSPAEADGWTKVEKEITISGIAQSIQLSGSTFYIDELRLYPKGSFMSTVCYDLFKNVITKTDVNLRSQFMEYDERRRLKLIRDHEKSILQHYDYKLAIN